METRTFARIVIPFLCAITFTNCSKDDKYHLELSESSCEVMQGSSIAIDLTAHENSTLEIENPELIEVAYIWQSGYQKAKLQISAKQTGETNIVITDHETGESASIKVTVTEYPMPRLAVQQPKGNIFDEITFYLNNEDQQAIRIDELPVPVCDSIVWTVDGLGGSYRVYEQKRTDSQPSLRWTHYFKYPGEYKTRLAAWKDNKIFYRDQLDITITNNKDFLLYNWSDITKTSQAWSSHVDVLKGTPALIATYGLNGTTPWGLVRLLNRGYIESYDPLYNYLCQLYSTPTYTAGTKKQNIFQLYNELFSGQKEYPDAYPEAIWVTERATIVLLMQDEDFPGYMIYAEPNRL